MITTSFDKNQIVRLVCYISFKALIFYSTFTFKATVENYNKSYYSHFL